MMTLQKSSSRPRAGAQISGLQRKLLICEESENRVSRFPWSKEAMDGLFAMESGVI